MALKLLIFGLPGSGKSTIARSIQAYLKDRNWDSIHFSDHVILRDMFLGDFEHKQFNPSEHGGFDVIDFKAFDIALKKLELSVKIHLLYAKHEEIVLVEFARNDYRWAFQQLSNGFLLDSYFLCLCVETHICKQRILKRVENPSSEDDFYVSEHIFSTYYSKDDARFIEQILIGTHAIDKHRVKVIDNNGPFKDSIADIYQFVDMICDFKLLRDS